MFDRPLRILLVEDNPGDARLVAEMLAQGGDFELERVTRLNEGLAQAGAQKFDLILLDLSLPDSSGLETVARASRALPQTPIVIMTGLDDEEVAAEAARLGVQDYIVKGHWDSRGLVRSIRYALERKRQELELAQKNRELEKLSRLKNQFLGMAAHDLRNPLTVIITCSDFLLDETGDRLAPERQREFLRRIRANAEFMVTLINDLLDFTSSEAGQIELNLERLDLEEVVAQNLAENRLLGAQKGIELVLNVLPLGQEVVADRQRLNQVLNNLLSNALKFSNPGTKVAVTVRPDSSGVIIEVKDEGQGIPASEMSKLFQPFEKTSVRSTAGERSTGLGLAICRQIIEAHQGRIWAESEPGKGSTFFVWLPGKARHAELERTSGEQ